MFFITIFLKQWMVLIGLVSILSQGIKVKCSLKKLLIATALGSFLGEVTILAPWGFVSIILLGVSAYLTVYTAFGHGKKQTAYYGIYLLILAVFFGGLWSFIRNYLQVKQWVLSYGVSMGIFCFLYWMFWEQIVEQKDGLYQVTFQLENKKISVCAFLDTGNFLYEPTEQLPVCILEEKVVTNCFKESFTKLIENHRINGIRVIPYHSVGNKEGVMLGVLIRQIIIKKKNQVWRREKAMVGIVADPLNRNGTYQMLLHSDLIKNQEGTMC